LSKRTKKSLRILTKNQKWRQNLTPATVGGNVLAVITDRKIGMKAVGTGDWEYFVVDYVSFAQGWCFSPTFSMNKNEQLHLR
jgi:hypothetical protein